MVVIHINMLWHKSVVVSYDNCSTNSLKLKINERLLQSGQLQFKSRSMIVPYSKLILVCGV